MKRKETFLLLGLVLLLLFIRIWALDTTPYDDNSWWAFRTIFGDVTSQTAPLEPFPPLSMWINQFFFQFIGESFLALRIVPLFFSIISTLLTFFIAKEMYGKKVAFWSTGIMAISFYHVLASLIPGIEGAILLTFNLFMLYFYILHEKTKEEKYLYLLGVAIALSLLSKSNGVVMLWVLLAHYLYKTRSIKKIIKKFTIPAIVSSLIFFSVNLFLFLINKPYFMKIYVYGQGLIELNTSLLSPLMLFFWATPLLIGFVLLTFFSKKEESNQDLSILKVWFLIYFIFFGFLVARRDFSRYFMSIIPCMAIMGGILIERHKITLQSLKKYLPLLPISFAILFLLNLLPIKYTSREVASYLNKLLAGKLSFAFYYTAPSGPNMSVSMLSLVLIFGLCYIFILACLFLKDQERKKQLFSIFLILSLSLNLFLVTEYAFHPTQPSNDLANQLAKEYIETNDPKGRILSNDEGMFYHIRPNYQLEEQFVYTGLLAELLEESFIEEGDLILLKEFPNIPEEQRVREVLGNADCKLEESFIDKGKVMVTAYSC